MCIDAVVCCSRGGRAVRGFVNGCRTVVCNCGEVMMIPRRRRGAIRWVSLISRVEWWRFLIEKFHLGVVEVARRCNLGTKENSN